MEKYNHFVFLVLGVLSLLVGNYLFTISNFVSAIGFALLYYRFHLVVKLKLQHIWEKRLRMLGYLLGYGGISSVVLLVLIKYLFK